MIVLISLVLDVFAHLHKFILLAFRLAAYDAPMLKCLRLGDWPQANLIHPDCSLCVVPCLTRDFGGIGRTVCMMKTQISRSI
jgi:hypothetical protein